MEVVVCGKPPQEGLGISCSDKGNLRYILDFEFRLNPRE